MNKKQRQQAIIEYLGAMSEASIVELVRLTESSIATIRRDLLEMHESGKLIRTPGGACNIVHQQSLVQRTFDQRRSHNAEAKLAIAAAAKELVHPNMTIAIDSGTTCWQLACLLTDIKPLRVITNAVAVIEALGDCPDIELIVVGGVFRQSNLDFTGAQTAMTMRKYAVDMAFLGCDGFLPGKGIYTDDMQSHAIGQAIAANAAQRVVLFDQQKLGQRHCCQILADDEIDCIITDAQVELPADSKCRYIHAL